MKNGGMIGEKERLPREPMPRGDLLIAAGVFSAALAVVFALAVFGLGGCSRSGELAAPCDSRTLADVALECRAAVRARCARNDAGVVDESCSVLRDCDERIARWRVCSDAGKDGG